MAWKCDKCHDPMKHQIVAYYRKKCETCGRWAPCLDCDNNGCDEEK